VYLRYASVVISHIMCGVYDSAKRVRDTHFFPLRSIFEACIAFFRLHTCVCLREKTPTLREGYRIPHI
jgi:hypothetical protein